MSRPDRKDIRRDLGRPRPQLAICQDGVETIGLNGSQHIQKVVRRVSEPFHVIVRFEDDCWAFSPDRFHHTFKDFHLGAFGIDFDDMR